MDDSENKMVDLKRAIVQEIQLDVSIKMQIRVDVLRLDQIHPVISGNKWFKLKYYLHDAATKQQQTLLTFGGAYSNHLLAVACAASESGLSTIGIIRGEENNLRSHTLEAAKAYGMQLCFVSREVYRKKENPAFIEDLHQRFGDFYLLPEGGAGAYGIKGSEEILDLVHITNYTHIMAAIGTGTMFTGIANASTASQEVIGIPVLKGLTSTLDQITSSLTATGKANRCRFFTSFHFGGYAKHNPELLLFMNRFYTDTGIATDFVYTGKLFYALQKLMEQRYFTAGSKVLVIHSGGLQGNRSLLAGTLLF